MGLDLVRVERVDPWQTPSGVMAYTVTGVTVEDQPRTVQFQTINDWKAALCSQTAQRGKLLWIGSKDSRFGVKDIVSVEIDTSKFEHESEAS